MMTIGQDADSKNAMVITRSAGIHANIVMTIRVVFFDQKNNIEELRSKKCFRLK